MKLTVINSNSFGNSYILDNKGRSLIIEAGVKYQRIKKALRFDISKVDGCLVTHEHMDHAKVARDIHADGIPILSHFKTKVAMNVNPTGYEIGHGQTMFLKNWAISAFDVNHDAVNPLGFIINNLESTHPILFVTDTYKLRWRMKAAFKTVIIEANYCEEIVEKWRSTKGNGFVESRRIKNHMSFQTAVKTLESLNLSMCENIVLIHLSDGLTDEKRFEKEIEKRFGIPCKCAVPGLELELENPY